MQKKDILDQLKRKRVVTMKELTASFGVSRAYINQLMHELRQEGQVILVGKTNRASYVLATNKQDLRAAKKRINRVSFKLMNSGLSEEVILKRLEQETGIFIDVTETVRQIVRYAFTEMLNNAIDHSHSKDILVECRRSTSAISFAIRDHGIGMFNNVREKMRLPGNLSAIQQILKGKTTTNPKEHSGQGVFFTSKMADVFIVDSYEKQLLINNLLPDIFVLERKNLKGTRVSFSIHLSSSRTSKEVFEKFSGGEDGDFAFNKTQISVKLYQFGTDLLSRSEAKRVTMGLENFQEIELDFKNVATIGQGFADEIFRVWQQRYPSTKLRATHANENVAFMIRRASGNVVS